MGDKLIVFTNCFQPPPLQSYRLLTCFIKAALLWEVSWGAWETSCDYTASLIPQPLSVSVYNLIGWGDGKISLHGLNFLFSVRICHAWLGALSWRLAFCLTSFAKESLLTVTQDWCASKNTHFTGTYLLLHRDTHKRPVSFCFVLHIFLFYCSIMPQTKSFCPTLQHTEDGSLKAWTVYWGYFV